MNCFVHYRFVIFTLLSLLYITGLSPINSFGSPLILTASEGRTPLAGHLDVFKDEAGMLTIQDVTSPAYSNRFKEIPGILPAGFYQHGAIWLRCNVKRATDSPSDWVLEIAPAYNEKLDLYISTATGGYDVYRGGALLPLSKRGITYRLDLFRLNLPPTLPTTLHIRIESKRSITANPLFWQPDALRKKVEAEALFHGAYIGVILLVTVFNMLYWFWFRKALYGYYFFYVLSIGFLFFSSYGYARQYLWPETTWLIAPGTFINFLLLMALTIGLMSEMLELHRHLPRTDRAVKTVFFGGAATGFFLILCGFHYQIISYIHISLLVCALVCIIIGTILIRRANGAVIYLSAFGILLISGVLQTLANVGIIPITVFSDNLLIFSTFVHIVVLTIAVLNNVVGIIREKYTIEAALAREQLTVENQRQFLRLISHELRTPLAVIDSTAQIIPFIKDDGEQVVRNAEAIRTATRQLSDLMNKYLTHDRLVSGGMQPDFKPVKIFELLRNLVLQIQLTADNHRINCELPEAPVVFSCDPILIEILVTLLLDNAVKYSPDGGAIVLRATSLDSRELQIDVIDCGSGMSQEQIDKAFEPYYRAHAVPGIGGLGLGLHLARHIAALHGGSISCSSAPSRGSTFSIILKQ